MRPMTLGSWLSLSTFMMLGCSGGAELGGDVPAATHEDGSDSEEARSALEDIRQHFQREAESYSSDAFDAAPSSDESVLPPSGVRLRPDGEYLRPAPEDDRTRTALVKLALPKQATERFHLEATGSGVAIEAVMHGTREAT